MHYRLVYRLINGTSKFQTLQVQYLSCLLTEQVINWYADRLTIIAWTFCDLKVLRALSMEI